MTFELRGWTGWLRGEMGQHKTLEMMFRLNVNHLREVGEEDRGK